MLKTVIMSDKKPPKRRAPTDAKKPEGYRMLVKIHPSLIEPLEMLAQSELADNSEMVKKAVLAYLKSLDLWPWTAEVRERVRAMIQTTEDDEKAGGEKGK